MLAWCGRFRNHINATMIIIMIPPKKRVKKRICFWCAVRVGLRFLTADDARILLTKFN